MNDNYARSAAPRLTEQRLTCERRFVELLRDLKSSGMSWTAIEKGVLAARGEIDAALDEIGLHASAGARLRRSRSVGSC